MTKPCWDHAGEAGDQETAEAPKIPPHPPRELTQIHSDLHPEPSAGAKSPPLHCSALLMPPIYHPVYYANDP